MKKLHIGIIDIVSRGPTRALYARVMNPNLASIMPQVIGVWCRKLGHEVSFVCYTGFENLLAEQAEGDLATPRSGCGAVDERSLSSVSTVTLP